MPEQMLIILKKLLVTKTAAPPKVGLNAAGRICFLHKVSLLWVMTFYTIFVGEIDFGND